MSSTAVAPLIERLDLERLDRDLFRGFSPDDGRPRVFGGQVAAQALVAAVRTVEDRVVHSFHSYFLRPGDPKIPILYEVDRIRDGRSFHTRRVVAIQEGEAIFSMAASFQTEERPVQGPSHAPTFASKYARIWRHRRAVSPRGMTGSRSASSNHTSARSTW